MEYREAGHSLPAFFDKIDKVVHYPGEIRLYCLVVKFRLPGQV